MEALWQKLVSGSSNFTLFALWPTIVVNLTWLGSGLFCLWLDSLPSLRKYKIQQHDNGTVEFAASVGASQARTEDRSIDDLLKRVATALHNAKAGGHDRVAVV